MAKKKVVDAELLTSRLRMLQGKPFAAMGYSGGYGGSDIDNALRMFGSGLTTQINQSVNQAFNMFIFELITTIDSASRDEHDGMCGLCRSDPEDMFPERPI